MTTGPGFPDFVKVIGILNYGFYVIIGKLYDLFGCIRRYL